MDFWCKFLNQPQRSAHSAFFRVEISGHQDRIFDWIRVVAWPPARLLKTMSTIESLRPLIGVANFEIDLGDLFVQKFLNHCLHQEPADPNPLGIGSHGDHLQFRFGDYYFGNKESHNTPVAGLRGYQRNPPHRPTRIES